jgi:hypothetical protein
VGYAEPLTGTIRIEGTGRGTGSRELDTDALGDAIVRVESTCSTWEIEMRDGAPTPAATSQPSDCHPSYSNVCLSPDSGDYDCAGGSGNGPNYVRGPVYVVGYDEFDLDRDNDGVGCES